MEKDFQSPPVDLATCSYGQVLGTEYDVVILPWGATEPHNRHLPYMTDCLLSHDVAVDAALLAQEQYGVQTMVLPAVPMGAQNPGQRELSFCLHYRQRTQQAILADIVESLHHQGLRRLLIVNGHGGNSFKGFIRDLLVDYPEMFILASDWFAVLPGRDYFDDPGDHADELETSVMMHYHPDLVHMSLAGDGRSRGFALASLQQKTAWLPRHWNHVSHDTGIGNPMASTPEKGRRFARAVAERYALLLRDLAAVNTPADLYDPS